MKTTEQRLIERVIRGERGAQQSLYETYASHIMSICLRYVGDRSTAEDLLHDTFLRIFSSIDHFQYRGEGSLRAWMDRIGVNCSLEWLRKRKRRDEVALEDGPIKTLTQDEEPSYNETKQIPHEVLLGLIAELPDGYRSVFNLYCIEEYSHKEIAKMLGIHEKSSSSQLLRAKRLLATKINNYLSSNE